MATVEPLVIPTKTIGWLVTCRLEKYREITEKWLRQHGISHERLIKMDLPDKKSRIVIGNHAKFKAEVYKQVDAVLFIERSLQQSYEIAKLARKSVLCIGTNQMFNPSNLVVNCNRGKKFFKQIVNSPLNAIITLLRFFKMRFLELKWKISAGIKKRIGIS